MKYPTFKVKGRPTPNDKLMVCETCQTGVWGPHSVGRIHYCCNGRLREATPQEYMDGKTALKFLI